MSTNPANPQPPESASDPSMEDILASIRRILNEEEPQAQAAPDVLELTADMRADPPATEAPMPDAPTPEAPIPEAPRPVARTPEIAAPLPPTPASASLALPQAPVAVEPARAPAEAPQPGAAAVPRATAASGEPPPPPAEPPALVAPAAAAAAAASVGELVRRLAAGPQAAISRNGPTIEDIVRDEIRGLLKAWLDENLPRVVERLVRAEIERVVSRHVG